jgi:hypothetical protein
MTAEQGRIREQLYTYSVIMFPKLNQRQFANIVTGDEIWVQYGYN